VIDMILSGIRESVQVKQRAAALAPAIAEAATLIVGALHRGGRVFVCGNGGSASDAQHFASEIVGRFESERRGLPCIALTTDSSMLTAWANDYSFDLIFARQVSALGNAGDVLVGISTSGNSRNVVRAFEQAREQGMVCIALVGRDGGEIGKMPGVLSVCVQAERTSRIQEVHILIIHLWSQAVDEAFT
jgi:D-sedoheptulose 7-phosphate isomerase